MTRAPLLPVLALALVLTPGPAAAGDPTAATEPAATFEIRTTAVPLNPEDAGETRRSRLEYRAGFALSSPWEGFGGLSGMALDADDTLRAVSDTGDWVEMRLRHDAAGTLAGVEGIRHGPLRDGSGDAVSGKRKADAEELVTLAEGDFLVAFERDHRLWSFPAGDGLAGLAAVASMPDGALAAEPNKGMEAAVQLADGRVLVLAEELRDGNGDHTGWVGDPLTGRWQALSLAATGSFLPTGLARLPDGDLVLVERSFNAALMLLKTRISRIRGGTVQAGARLMTEELARLTPPLTNDNLEAIAARRGPGGETLIYVLSDDNFNRGLQRTLLLQFALTD